MAGRCVLFAPHEMSFVKILSDNGDTEGITPDYITALVENHINIIDEYINRLRDILNDISCADDEKAAKEKQLADKLCWICAVQKRWNMN